MLVQLLLNLSESTPSTVIVVKGLPVKASDPIVTTELGIIRSAKLLL